LTIFLAAILFGSSPARAGRIVTPTFDTASFGQYNTPAGIAAIESAFNFAAQEYQSLFTDPVHVNIGGVDG
jgi:hypothetical protein